MIIGMENISEALQHKIDYSIKVMQKAQRIIEEKT